MWVSLEAGFNGFEDNHTGMQICLTISQADVCGRAPLVCFLASDCLKGF